MLGNTRHSNYKVDKMSPCAVGQRISKFDIRAIKVGPAAKVFDNGAHIADFNTFNKTLIGPEGLYPTKNGAPRILTQYKVVLRYY